MGIHTREPAGAATGAFLWLALASLSTGACGPLDPGESVLARPGRAPDAIEFATRIHPTLVESCALSNCHARSDASLVLHRSETPFVPPAQPIHPLELPAPYAEDYYLVLAFCDRDAPAQSRLVRWGSGAQKAHPGGEALKADDAAAILNWLAAP